MKDRDTQLYYDRTEMNTIEQAWMAHFSFRKSLTLIDFKVESSLYPVFLVFQKLFSSKQSCSLRFDPKNYMQMSV